MKMDSQSHAIEPELTGQTPRPARFTGRNQAIRLSLWVLTVIIPCLLCWIAWRETRDITALRTAGRPATAQVTSKDVQYSNNIASYDLNYAFEVNGRRFTGEEDVDKADYDAANVLTPINVVYLPSDPKTNRAGAVDSASIAFTRALWSGAALVVLLILGGMAWYYEAISRNRLRLLRDGVAVVAVVTNRRVAASENTRGQTTTKASIVQYRFTVPPEGEQVKEMPVPESLYETCVEGSSLTVLYESARPKNSVPYLALTEVTLT